MQTQCGMHHRKKPVGEPNIMVWGGMCLEMRLGVPECQSRQRDHLRLVH